MLDFWGFQDFFSKPFSSPGFSSPRLNSRMGKGNPLPISALASCSNTNSWPRLPIIVLDVFLVCSFNCLEDSWIFRCELIIWGWLWRFKFLSFSYVYSSLRTLYLYSFDIYVQLPSSSLFWKVFCGLDCICTVTKTDDVVMYVLSMNTFTEWYTARHQWDFYYIFQFSRAIT